MHSTSVAVSREPRRAKTDRLDTEMLIRVFLGWLRGEPRHCKMVTIPTLEEEDARRPSREREILVGERTRIVNRMKAALVRLGIRGSKPKLLTAPQKLDALRTPEETPIPPNMLDEMRRDMARLAWVREQINAIEQARLERLERVPATGRHAMVRMLARVIGVGVETAVCWCKKFCPETCETDGPWPVTLASPRRQTRAGRSRARFFAIFSPLNALWPRKSERKTNVRQRSVA
jgi:transposase